MKLNLKRRISNPAFWVQIVVAIITPVIAFFGLSTSDFQTWQGVFSSFLAAISNPYVLFLIAVSVFTTLQDPTTKGFSDSPLVLNELSSLKTNKQPKNLDNPPK